MNGLTRYDPFRELDQLENRLSSFLSWPWRRGRAELEVSQWAPPVDIMEDDKEFVITAELPEMKKEDIQITFENNTLSICGERKFEQEQKGRRFHRVERGYGSFCRSFTVPESAQKEQINAEFKDGVLRVHVPKSEKRQTEEAKQIAIK